MIEVEVSNAQAAELFQFLRTTTGQTILKALTVRRPSLSGKTLEERSITSAKAEGWEKCIDELINISTTRSGPPDLGESKPMNPSLEDDRLHKPPAK